ncbi:hypothetical protein Tco_0864698, partial [Tanacetum coccineum]
KKAQQLEPKLYVGDIIEKTNPIVIPDFEETLLLAEESRSKMLLKQKDPIMFEKKVNTTPVNYVALNQLYKDFKTRFVQQTELSAEQAFWYKNLVNSPEPILSSRPTIVEVPKELPKVSIVNTSLKKLKHHLAGFDVVVKERTTSTTITKGSWGDNSVSNQSAPSFDQLFELNELNAQSQKKDTVIKKLKERVKVLTLKDDLKKLKGKAPVDNDVAKHPSDPKMLKIDVEPITPKLLNKQTTHSAYIKHTQEEATILRDLVEHVKSKYPLDQSLEYACSGCDPKEQGQKRVKPSTSASRSQPSGNIKKDKIWQTTSSTQKNKVEAHPRKVKSSLKNKDCVVESKGTAHVQHSRLNANYELKCVKCNGCMLSANHDLCVLDFINNVNARNKSKSVKEKRNECPLTRITTTTEVPLRIPTSLDNETSKPVVTLVYSRKPRKSKTNVVQIVLYYLDFGCSKHMTEDRSQLTNFVNKFLGIGKFGNDHVAKILGYGDYQIGNVMISRVYYVEGLGHNLFSMGQFCDSNLDVVFRQHTCFIRNLEGVDLLNGSRGNNLYTLSLGDMMASSPICLLSKASKTKSWLWHRHFDELTVMASEHSSSGPVHHEMTPATISSGLVPNPPPSTPFIPPSRTNWDILFQPMFDELLTPPPSIDLLALEVTALIDEVVALVPAISTGSPSSTTVNQDEPSPSNSQTAPKTQPPIIPNDVEENNHDIEVAHMGNDLYFGIPIPEVLFDQSSTTDSTHTIVHSDHQISEHNSKWTKDHPLENIIGELARPVSTRLQLHEQALFCYYDAFLTAVEPKTYKDALT